MTATRQRRPPIRTCLGCGQTRPKLEMIRVVRTPDGEIVVDTSRGAKRNGRGAYVEPRLDCVAALRLGRRLGRELEVDIPDAVYDELAAIATVRERATSSQ